MKRGYICCTLFWIAGVMMMDPHLTEINNAHLFMDYLRCSGIKSPISRSDDWEFVEKDQVIARIKNDDNGKIKFFICAAMLGRK
jgi:hypothetical protein